VLETQQFDGQSQADPREINDLNLSSAAENEKKQRREWEFVNFSDASRQ
jgi:hypothetical protein